MGIKGQGAWNRTEFNDMELKARYADLKQPVSCIAESYGCSNVAVYRRLGELGITRTNSEAHKGQVPWNKRGWYKDSGGYVMLLLDGDDPYYAMATKGGYIREHRYVMAEYLGRPLDTWEVVHHLNGIKDDNDIENLKLYPSQGEHLSVTFMETEIRHLRQEVLRLEQENEELRAAIKAVQGDGD